MTDAASSNNRVALRLPTITMRSFLLGMTAMNVVNGIMILFVLCFFPMVLLFIAGLQHPSVLRLHFIFAGLVVIGISFGLNILFIGTWCFRGLFGSLNRRIIVVVVLLVWHLLLWFWDQVDYLDIGLVTALLCVTFWDRFYRGAEQL
ncbi:MAG: hypothetical protein ABSF87_05290 [Xanthobacteraceae bacterium]